ncbi:MAG: hypothetical protein GY719_36295 [bacterium]|nr:hypothetical protein [bacterium]
MSKDEQKPAAPEDSDLAREARAGFKFDLAEAIGRLGGGDLLKGASPVTRKRQVEVATDLFLEEHLADSEGALLVVLDRRVRESMKLTQESYDHPLLALSEIVEHVLGREDRLQLFVRQVDAEWGRMYLERPHFQKPGQKPHRDDPYTFESVRETLAGLLDTLAEYPDLTGR